MFLHVPPAPALLTCPACPYLLPSRFDANAELAPEGFCQISCSRCNCCQPPVDVLKTLGATRFLQVGVGTTRAGLGMGLLRAPGREGGKWAPSGHS